MFLFFSEIYINRILITFQYKNYIKNRRCKIGCGCGRNKNNKVDRIKKLEAQARSARLAKSSLGKDITGMIAKKKLMQKKLNLCKTCSYSTQTKQERRTKTRVCHKSNISIQAIMNNSKFKCPKGKF